MLDILRVHWFEVTVAVYIVLGVVGPVVTKLGAPRVGGAMTALGANLGQLLATVRPGYVPPELPKADK